MKNGYILQHVNSYLIQMIEIKNIINQTSTPAIANDANSNGGPKHYTYNINDINEISRTSALSVPDGIDEYKNRFWY